MTKNKNHDWPYPGSRWWKFDFHSHTPASHDTHSWRRAVGRMDAVTPEKWLLKYMEAGIDCVAVTDHNSGAWIDKLKTAYDQLKEQTEDQNLTNGFRDLTLFPGVEISVNGGIHILAIFETSADTHTITKVLGAVGYDGDDGDSNGVTQKSAANVVKAVLEFGGIPIPAHADQKKGLLQVKPSTHESIIDANTVRQTMDVEGLLAVEWIDNSLHPPECIKSKFKSFAKVLGSDCHNFRDNSAPGSRFTWVKMAHPSLEGLRLALLDGDGVSLRRSDEVETFEPFQKPKNFIVKVEIDTARFMGNGNVEQLCFSPYYNALIGGRGTGKSTIVHAMRLAFRRREELQELGEQADPYRHFFSFIEPVKGRHSDGALKENTEIRIELMRDEVMHRLRWREDGSGATVEEQGVGGEWHDSESQVISTERFPIRLLSQGQIAALTGESRQALLSIIDEGAGVGELKSKFEEAKRTYFALCARLRELEGRLESKPEVKRKLAEINQKLKILEQSDHAEVLKKHQQAQRQHREVSTTIEQLAASPKNIDSIIDDLLLDDWPDGTFDPAEDKDVIVWRGSAGRVMKETQEALSKAVQAHSEKVEALKVDPRLMSWRERVNVAQSNYRVLQESLTRQGIKDPGEFGRLLQMRQQLEDQVKQLDQNRKDRDNCKNNIQIQFARISKARRDITVKRDEFLRSTLETNNFVRMKVVGFGYDARNIERSLRELLDVLDERFENDILKIVNGNPESGLAFDLASSNNKEVAIENAKQRMIKWDKNLGGHFRNHLQKKIESMPEFADHIYCWFPDDDLKIEYSRTGDGYDWSAISQASQGQRSAALLAFLLAFGDEPLILDQPEDDLDNHLIYDLIVRQIRENKQRRQLVVVTHNPNVVVNGDAEMVHAFAFGGGQCRVIERGALQEKSVRKEVCDVMEGGYDALARRWARLGREV